MQRKLPRYWSELVIMFAAVAVMIVAAMSPAAGAAGTAAAGGSLGGRVIVLNPGHGGHERGAVGPAGLEEGVINLKVATYLKAFLEEQGATVFLTREGDYDLDLYTTTRTTVTAPRIRSRPITRQEALVRLDRRLSTF